MIIIGSNMVFVDIGKLINTKSLGPGETIKIK